MEIGVERISTGTTVNNHGGSRVSIDDTVSFVWGNYFEIDEGNGKIRIAHEMP